MLPFTALLLPRHCLFEGWPLQRKGPGKEADNFHCGMTEKSRTSLLKPELEDREEGKVRKRKKRMVEQVTKKPGPDYK